VPSEKIQSAAAKIEQNIRKQKNEIQKFFNGEEGFSAADMAKKSMERLEKYKSVRARDVGYWVKIQKERDRQTEAEKFKGEPKKNEKKAKKAKAQ
jgi:aspartate carbamoyltransferase catalytic subunit